MIDEIVKNTRRAAAVLRDIRAIPLERLDKDILLPLLRKAVSLKLMISDEDESFIRNLVIMSIKQQDMRSGDIPDYVIRQQIRKYDCHQTSLVAQKKTLLFMFMEKELDITLGDDEAVGIETMDELAQAFIRHLKEGEEIGCP